MFSQMDDAHDKLSANAELGGGKTNYNLEIWKQSTSGCKDRPASMHTSMNEGNDTWQWVEVVVLRLLEYLDAPWWGICLDGASQNSVQCCS